MKFLPSDNFVLGLSHRAVCYSRCDAYNNEYSIVLYRIEKTWNGTDEKYIFRLIEILRHQGIFYQNQRTVNSNAGQIDRGSFFWFSQSKYIFSKIKTTNDMKYYQIIPRRCMLVSQLWPQNACQKLIV